MNGDVAVNDVTGQAPSDEMRQLAGGGESWPGDKKITGEPALGRELRKRAFRAGYEQLGGVGVDLMLQFSCVLRALRTYSGNDVYEELIKGLFELRALGGYGYPF